MRHSSFVRYFLVGVLAIVILFFVGIATPHRVFAVDDAIKSSSLFPDFKLQVPFHGYDEKVKLITADGNTIVATGMATYFGQLYAWLITAVAIIAVVMLMVGGMQWMTSRGSSGQTQKAIKIISNALIGLVLTLGAYSILYLINPVLVQWPVIRLGAIQKMDITVAEIRQQQSSGGGEKGVGSASISQNLTTYDTALKSASTEFPGVDCTLLKAFMFAESSGNPNAQSSVGAQGLIQLMPATAADVRSRHNITGGSSFDPLTNARTAAAYLSDLKTGGCNGGSTNSQSGCDMTQIKYLAAAYNGGPGANRLSSSCSGTTLWECEVNTGYKETRVYAPRVEGNYNKLKANSWGC